MLWQEAGLYCAWQRAAGHRHAGGSVGAVRAEPCVTCLLPLSSRRGLPSLGCQLLQEGQKEASALHEGAVERTGAGICHEQVHYQGQTEADISHDEPLGEAGHYLVPEQEGQREKSHQQTEDH